MNIKRLIIFITIIIFSLGLLSYNSSKSMVNDRVAELNFSSDEEIADTYFEKIIKSLENKDKEEIKKIFSPQVLKYATNIDGDIDYIMNLYNGKIKSKKFSYGESDKTNYGKREKELKVLYTVETDQDTYIVFFIDKIKDTENPDNVGICMLQIIKKSDEDEEFDWGNKIRCEGIYRPDSAK